MSVASLEEGAMALVLFFHETFPAVVSEKRPKAWRRPLGEANVRRLLSSGL